MFIESKNNEPFLNVEKAHKFKLYSIHLLVYSIAANELKNMFIVFEFQ